MSAGNSTKTEVKRSMLNSAVAYARAGLHVFPILELTKDQPLVKWRTAATSNVDQITIWWTRWPNANIGLSCGPSGIAVIDSDVKPHGDGETTLRSKPRLTPTKISHTPSGGVHRYYRGELPSTAGRMGPFVDTRGVGGYVLLPPSRRPEGCYHWQNRQKVAPLDRWVIDICGHPRRGEPVSQEPVVNWDMPENVERAREWLTTDAPVSIEGRGGDDVLVKRVVPILKDMGISEDKAGELLAEFWNRRCDPPWLLGDCDPRDNLYVKIHNGFLYCRDNQPGSLSAIAAFGNEPLPTDEEIARFAAHWTTHDRQHRKQLARARRLRRKEFVS